MRVDADGFPYLTIESRVEPFGDDALRIYVPNWTGVIATPLPRWEDGMIRLNESVSHNHFGVEPSGRVWCFTGYEVIVYDSTAHMAATELAFAALINQITKKIRLAFIGFIPFDRPPEQEDQIQQEIWDALDEFQRLYPPMVQAINPNTAEDCLDMWSMSWSDWDMEGGVHPPIQNGSS
jgi:hypothetical protein